MTEKRSKENCEMKIFCLGKQTALAVLESLLSTLYFTPTPLLIAPHCTPTTRRKYNGYEQEPTSR